MAPRTDLASKCVIALASVVLLKINDLNEHFAFIVFFVLFCFYIKIWISGISGESSKSRNSGSAFLMQQLAGAEEQVPRRGAYVPTLLQSPLLATAPHMSALAPLLTHMALI